MPRSFRWGGAKTEGREREWGSWGGQQPRPHPLDSLGERYELPSGVRGGAPAAQRFSAISSTHDGLSTDTIILLMWTIMQPLGGGGAKTPVPPPLAYTPAAGHLAVSLPRAYAFV